MKLRYIVITKQTEKALAEAVSKAMDEGYVPWGSLAFSSVNGIWYSQAMIIKYNV